MIICEMILIGTSSVFISIIGGLCVGYYKSISKFIRQIKNLEDEVFELTEKIKKVQLNEISGLNI